MMCEIEYRLSWKGEVMNYDYASRKSNQLPKNIQGNIWNVSVILANSGLDFEQAEDL